MIAAFLNDLEKQEHLITDFDPGLWNALIETMTIYSKEHIVFKFKGSTEIKWSIAQTRTTQRNQNGKSVGSFFELIFTFRKS